MNNLKDLLILIKLSKGIEFKDVLGIIQEPRIFRELILNMSSSQIIKNADAIISIDARGFILVLPSLARLQANDCSKKAWKLQENL